MHTNPFIIKLFHPGNVNHAEKEHSSQKNIFYLPMGLFALADQLNRNHFNVEIIHSDLISERSLHEALDLNSVDAIGFDCFWVNQSYNAISQAEEIKRLNPGVIIFMGGFTASLFAEEILETFESIDYIIKGDGEIPIVELCQQLSNKKLKNQKGEEDIEEFYNISNLVFRHDKRIVSSKKTYIAEQSMLDSLNFSGVRYLRKWLNYRDLCKFWTKFTSINKKPLFFLEIGRGCIYNCTFCGGNSVAQACINKRKGQIVRSVEAVMDTIEETRKLGFEMFYTCFEFPGSDEWFVNLLKKIEKKISFGYGCWSLPSNKLIDALSENCDQIIIEISPETGEENLRKINKDKRLYYTNDDLLKTLEYISRKPNIKVQLYFGYFLPYDNKASIVTTMKFILEIHNKYFNFVELIYNNLSTDPGSLIFFDPDTYDIEMNVRTFKDYLNVIKYQYTSKDNAPKDLSLFKPKQVNNKLQEKIQKTLYLFNYIVFNYRNSLNILLNYVNSDKIVKYIEDVDVQKISYLYINRFTKEFLITIFQQTGIPVNSINIESEANVLPVGTNTEFLFDTNSFSPPKKNSSDSDINIYFNLS